MAKKLGKVVTYHEELPLARKVAWSFNDAILWGKVTLSNLYLHFHQTNGRQTWSGGDGLTFRGFHP